MAYIIFDMIARCGERLVCVLQRGEHIPKNRYLFSTTLKVTVISVSCRNGVCDEGGSKIVH